MKLNRTGSNWNELERNKINENWDIIEGGYNDVVGQITDEVVGHLIDSAKLNWKEPVETEADLPKDAEVGETRMVRKSGDGVSHVYRYNGERWGLIQEIDATLVNEVDRRITAQLAQTSQRVEQEINTKEIKPLYINTFEGSNEPIHPSVVYFTNGWNGYKFWMAYTPWPAGEVDLYTDRWECPSIACSNDGVTWITPSGLYNPIVDLTESQVENNDYFSDPCIVMNSGTMEVWYRHTNGSDTSNTNIYRVTSSNGATWSDPEMVVDSQNPNNGIGGGTFRSQSVIRKDGKYFAYYSRSGGMKVAEITDPSTGQWENERDLVMSTLTNPWHASVYLDDEKGTYHMLAYYSGKYESVRYFISKDGINFQYKKIIVLTSDKRLSNLTGLYQSTLVKVGGDWYGYIGGTFRNQDKSFRGIYLMKGDDPLNLSIVDAPNHDQNTKVYEYDIVLSNNDKPNAKPSRIVLSQNPQGGIERAIGLTYKDGKDVLTYYKRSEEIPLEHADSGFIRRNRTNVALQQTITIPSDTYRVVVNTVETDEPIAFIEGGVDGQEIILINSLLSVDITLIHGSRDPNRIRLREGNSKTLGGFRGVLKLHNLSGIWYEL